MSTEPNIRNRVAGAVVLVALAVIFLPLILDGKKKNQILESQLPDKPSSGEIILVNINDNNTTEEKTPDDAEPVTDVSSSDKNSITIDAGEITAEKSTDTKPPAKAKEVVSDQKKDTITEPVVSETRKNRPNYAREGHLVKVGGFSSRDNANKLVIKLKAAQYRAYYKRGTLNSKPYYRVFVGPYPDKADAEKAVPQLSKLAGIAKPVIEAFDPLIHGQG